MLFYIALPAACSSYTEISEATRHLSYGKTSPQCDSGIQVKWYRFTGSAGSSIQETCPPINRCNTDAPGWLNGNHPTVAEGEVSRTVCYHWGGSCCKWSNSIKVLNCGDFYVYELRPPPVCSLRYCGGDLGERLWYLFISSQQLTTMVDMVYVICSLSNDEEIRQSIFWSENPQLFSCLTLISLAMLKQIKLSRR